MAVFVRTYATIDPPDAGRAYYARAIAQEAALDADGKPTGKWREGFSVGFYAETAEAATAKAEAWIEAERVREVGISEARAALAEKRRRAA
ncbi:hypothetical protein [Methylobacterium sp. WL7]|uniref:hypothetical protein n=1 Tax=Methylobacterium sp. WL7 TaxID=2603900 RepID=UPI001650C906|nr:hypothetical protein [Methylobacterium sp. WL7]